VRPRHRRGRRDLPVRTIDRWRIAVGGTGGRGRGCGSCMSVAGSHSWDRPTAGSPVDCSWGPRRCGPTRRRGGGPTTCPLRRRQRSSPTERRRDTSGRNELGGRRPTRRRIRAIVPCSTCAATTPDKHCRSKLSDCALRAQTRTRDTASCDDATTGRRQARPRVEPPVRIELTAFRLQDECSTTELRGLAGHYIIGSLVGLDDPL
jgi:hypothetical protein